MFREWTEMAKRQFKLGSNERRWPKVIGRFFEKIKIGRREESTESAHQLTH